MRLRYVDTRGRRSGFAWRGAPHAAEMGRTLHRRGRFRWHRGESARGRGPQVPSLARRRPRARWTRGITTRRACTSAKCSRAGPVGTRPGTTWASASRPGIASRPRGMLSNRSRRIRPGPDGATSGGRGSPWTAAGSPSARICSSAPRRGRARTWPRRAGAWCSCSGWKGDSMRPGAVSRPASTRCPRAVVTLQRLYKLDVDPFPIEGVRRGLESAARQAPDDDRVWLARAHLAIRVGRSRGGRELAGPLPGRVGPRTRRSGG